ncbi:hypothetical protein [Blastococcus haudaquaticus]|uniref:Glycosyltransferase RgtA/B/C/D-like domain-containing protein n=1 Tax=Blastococcus haudaquaticus TaxID=1938745 RepID=A0A286GS51_9ACTN|nr:hypothetical protein [Blastococcus haudaquaticus]SOD97889.1 hypothetical protein SAMN06272739_1650 [Blastococcus haudaquaticus]
MTQPRGDLLEVVVRRLPLYTLAAFLVGTVVLSTLAWATYATVGPPISHQYLDGPAWLDVWFQGDSGWYHSIAAEGYSYTPGQQSSIAFFPVFPLLVLAVGQVLGGDYSTAAGLVTLVCASGALMLFADWVRARLAPRTAVVAVAVALLYPYSFFLYGSGYSDASFLLTTLGAFALLERRHYVLAGLVGALATAGRPVGVAVAAGLVVRAAELIAEERSARRDAAALVGSGAGTGAHAEPPDGVAVPPRPLPSRPLPLRALVDAVPRMRWREASLLLSGAGLVAWMSYLGVRFGDPVAFATVQGAPGWNQGAGPYTWFKVPFIGTLLKGIWHDAVLLVPQALACLAAVLLVRTVWRRFGWGYAAYTVIALAIPIIGTKDFMGSGRYVLAAFPVLAAAAVVLTGDRRPRRLVPVVLAVLLVGLCIATVAFVNGVEVS